MLTSVSHLSLACCTVLAAASGQSVACGADEGVLCCCFIFICVYLEAAVEVSSRRRFRKLTAKRLAASSITSVELSRLIPHSDVDASVSVCVKVIMGKDRYLLAPIIIVIIVIIKINT